MSALCNSNLLYNLNLNSLPMYPSVLIQPANETHARDHKHVYHLHVYHLRVDHLHVYNLQEYQLHMHPLHMFNLDKCRLNGYCLQVYQLNASYLHVYHLHVYHLHGYHLHVYQLCKPACVPPERVNFYLCDSGMCRILTFKQPDCVQPG